MVVPYTCWGSEQSDHRFGPTTNNRTSIVNCIIRTGAGIMDWSAHVDKFQACGLCCDMPVAIRHRLQRVATMADLLECFWKLKPTEIQGYEITISGGFLAWCNLTRHVQVWAHGFQNGEWMWPTFWMAFHLELCCCSICFNNFFIWGKASMWCTELCRTRDMQWMPLTIIFLMCRDSALLLKSSLREGL